MITLAKPQTVAEFLDRFRQQIGKLGGKSGQPATRQEILAFIDAKSAIIREGAKPNQNALRALEELARVYKPKFVRLKLRTTVRHPREFERGGRR